MSKDSGCRKVVKTDDSLLITTLINPIHVFSGAVSPEDYINAQVSLIQDLGSDVYASILLETLHKELTSIIQEIKMEHDHSVRPNVSFTGQA